MISLSLIAVVIVGVHSFWCLLSRRVSDGIIGKVLYLCVVLSAFGVFSHPGAINATEVFNCSIAAISIRHFYMKVFWPSIKLKVINRIRCATCPHKEVK